MVSVKNPLNEPNAKGVEERVPVPLHLLEPLLILSG